jgi:two-component system chemotaxis sensor kinase CheA
MKDLSIFKATYITECTELLKDMEELLLSLDEHTEDLETLNAIFRCAHSIKGGAGVFGLKRVAEFTHVLEALLDHMRNGTLSVSQDIIDILLTSKDTLEQMIIAADKNQEPPANFEQKVKDELLKYKEKGGSSNSAPKTINETPQAENHDSNQNKFYNIEFKPSPALFQSGNEQLLIIRELKRAGTLVTSADISNIPQFELMDVEKCYTNFKFELESRSPVSVINEAFEFVASESEIIIEEVAGIFDRKATTSTANQATMSSNDNNSPATSASAPAPEIEKPKQTITSIRVDVDKIDKLVNLVGELVITQSMIKDQTKGLQFDQFGDLVKGVEELTHHTRELQDAVMSVRMQPVKSLFSRMPRVVRDLAKKLDKDIKLDLVGESTEVDKTIIEQLSDPLTHIIRNSVDHGIETPAIRKAAGKPEQGHMKLSADQVSGKIVISVEDDGAGINRERVTNKAIDQLIFHAGFSTAAVVSEVSGRGVGMDVVRRNIEGIGGSVELFNRPGKGLKLNVYIPLTLAILDGMIVSVGGESYIIPISNILETLEPKAENLKTIADGNDVVFLRGEYIKLIHLCRIFNIQDAISETSKALVVIVEANGSKYGLVVDELKGQQQVVIKSLDENSTRIDGLSGATILGDGKVSLILDMAKLGNIGLSDNNIMSAA